MFSTISRLNFRTYFNTTVDKPKAIPRLCLIVNRACFPSEKTVVDRVCRAVEGGFTEIQLHYPKEMIPNCLQTARRLKTLIGDRALLIANNWPEVAFLAELDGVHLGKHDYPLVEARELLGPKAILGYTLETWDDLVAPQVNLFADYFGIKLFPSLRTQPNGPKPWGLPLLQEALKHLSKPVVVVGQITEENLPKVASVLRLPSGDGAAMVGDACRLDDPYFLATRLRTIMDRAFYEQEASHE